MDRIRGTTRHDAHAARRLAFLAGLVAMLIAAPSIAAFSGTKSFAPGTITSGGISTMSISVGDPLQSVILIAYTDTFPSGMNPILGSETATNCGLTAVVKLTATTLDVSDASAVMGPCIVQVKVTAVVPVTTTLVNTTSTISYFSGITQTIPGVSGALQVVVPGVAPTITSPPPPGGQVGIAYDHAVTVAGTAPITVTASGLPPGLSFSPATLHITGTPTLAGSFAGALVARNGFPPNAAQNFTIVITAPPLTIVTPPAVLATPVAVGTAIDVVLQAAGGLPPYLWSVVGGALPPGVTLDVNGRLAGKPTKPGTYSFDARVFDSVGRVATRTYTLFVVKIDGTLNVTVTPNPVTSGQPMTITATVTGAVAATGSVDVWIAGTGTRCPAPFSFGDPASPVAALQTAPLDATGRAVIIVPNLKIDDYGVCARYGGDANFNEAFAGPIDAYVIKGVLLAPPMVTLAAPDRVASRAAIPAQVTVTSRDTTLIPGGVVRVLADGQPVATAALAGGVAWVVLTAPAAPGTMSLAAEYTGDGVFPPTMSAPVAVSINGASGVAIPSLSEPGLALLALLLIGIAGLRLRRRQ